jgi:3-hydroxyisobutyrate dehydrogenase/2-hydroxy-3-oxopropionate reductase
MSPDTARGLTPEDKVKTVGLIGCGVMGLAAAGAIIGSGLGLVAFDVRPEAVRKAMDLGARPAASPAALGREADMVIMFLPGPRQVEQAVAGLLATARAGLVVVDMSTVDPSSTERMAGLARERGVAYLDAPVLGRPASLGSWTLPVGGSVEGLERCRPVLELLAGRVVHVGPPGAGNKVKLLNQLMFSAINAMTAEMMAVSEKVGIPPATLFEIITSSKAATVSGLFLELGRNIVAGAYDDPTFSVDLLAKDTRLAVAMASEHGAVPVLGRTIQTVNEIAQAQGFGSKDTSAMWEVFRSLWGGCGKAGGPAPGKESA